MTIKFWSVSHGPGISHLVDAKIFDRLKDARAFADGLSQPFKIYKHTREHGLSNEGDDVIIDANLDKGVTA